VHDLSNDEVCWCPECNPDKDESHTCEECKDCGTCYESEWEHCGCSHPAEADKTWTSTKTGLEHRTREVTSGERDSEFGKNHTATEDRKKWIRVEHRTKLRHSRKGKPGPKTHHVKE
jgi:hypothetical protein